MIDFENDLKTSNQKQKSLFENKSYELPDGTVITIGNEMFRCSEILFKPSMIDLECFGITQMIEKTISTHENMIQNEFCSNIVLCGGTSMFSGLNTRIKNEIEKQFIEENTL